MTQASEHSSVLLDYGTIRSIIFKFASSTAPKFYGCPSCLLKTFLEGAIPTLILKFKT